MSFSQNTSKSSSQIQVKIVHKYSWKFARKHLHSLTIETEIGPWSRLLLLQLARNVASLFDPDSKYCSTSSKYFSVGHQLFCYFQYIGKKSVGYHPLFLTGQKAILEMLMLNNKRNSDGVKLSIFTLVLGGRPPCVFKKNCGTLTRRGAEEEGGYCS